MNRNKTQFVVSVVLGIFTVVLIGHGLLQAQDHASGWAYSGVVPYKEGIENTLPPSGNSIPVFSGSFVASKNGTKYQAMIVGGSPFAKASTAVNFLIIPLIVQIGSTTFDPTVDDPCIPGATITPLAAFQQSPDLQPVTFDGGSGTGHAAKMNGVDVGTTTYPDAMRRAEFWSIVKGSNYHTTFKVTTGSPWTITAAEVQQLGGGNVLPTGCASLGVLDTNNFQNYIQNTVVPSIPAIQPTTFAFFLMKDVVTTTSKALNCLNGCEAGYHEGFGPPVQTWAVAEYDSTQGFWFQAGMTDISIITHEIGEWMDDPLGLNATPPWGNIGQVSGCQADWEVGDPLTGTDFPAISMLNGVTYDPQELAFFSWYYNAQHAPSIGAGGKFSTNGTFSGPSKPCPPGGTY